MKHYDPHVHRRQSLRLKGYDYSQQGAYFVTVCTQNREYLFGEIRDCVMQINAFGTIANNGIKIISEHFHNVYIDNHIIMPNHLHLILMMNSTCRGGVPPPFSASSTHTQTGGVTPPLRKITLGKIIAFYKYQTTKQINKLRNTTGIPVWQRNYYEHIIRNEDELHQIREYIINNPLQWDDDENNPVNFRNSRIALR